MSEISRIKKVVIQFRRDTTEEWNKNENDIPACGEPCYDLNLGTLRVGDGNTPYKDLKVIGSGAVSDDGLSLIVDEIKADVVELQNLVGEISIEDQIANALIGVSYEINEVELQDMLDSVLDN